MNILLYVLTTLPSKYVLNNRNTGMKLSRLSASNIYLLVAELFFAASASPFPDFFFILGSVFSWTRTISDEALFDAFSFSLSFLLSSLFFFFFSSITVRISLKFMNTLLLQCIHRHLLITLFINAQIWYKWFKNIVAKQNCTFVFFLYNLYSYKNVQRWSFFPYNLHVFAWTQHVFFS